MQFFCDKNNDFFVEKGFKRIKVNGEDYVSDCSKEYFDRYYNFRKNILIKDIVLPFDETLEEINEIDILKNIIDRLYNKIQ